MLFVREQSASLGALQRRCITRRDVATATEGRRWRWRVRVTEPRTRAHTRTHTRTHTYTHTRAHIHTRRTHTYTHTQILADNKQQSPNLGPLVESPNLGPPVESPKRLICLIIN